MREIPHRRLLWIFIAVQLLFTPFSQLNHNTSSRFAAMGAFCSTGHFEISPYLSETDDWSRTPDGKSYSNKAPGTLFIAAPFYCGALRLEQALSPAPASDATRVKNEWKLRFVMNLALSALLQLLPWIWICACWDRKLRELGASPEGIDFAWIALLFGTTPAILMDVWIGHPIVAFFSLLALLAIFEKRGFLLGLSLAMMQLTEYSSVLLVPGALLAWFALPTRDRREFARELSLALLGAVIPAALWVIYHQSAFGSPWVIANRFQNPMFQDSLAHRVQLWGILTLPDPIVALKLLFGWWRGILFSQPWILVAVALTPAMIRDPKARTARAAAIYSMVGLGLLWLMNASFGGWHGGSVAGPRYLSAALPVFAIPVALTWKSLNPLQRKLLWGSLFFSCAVFFLAKIFSPTAGLWPEWIGYFTEKPLDFAWKAAVELAVVVVALQSSPHAAAHRISS